MSKICIYIFVALVVVSVVFAAPPWKKTTTTQPKTATKDQPTTIVVQNVTKIIVQNQTSPQEKGVNWESIGAIVGIAGLAAGFLGWFLSRKERGTTAKYLREIDRAFNQYRDDTSRCESALYDIKEKIEKEFSHGKINDSAFSILDARLDKYLAEVRKGVISTQFKLSEETKKKLENMLEDGVISKEEYATFSKMNIKELSAKDRARLKSLMKKWEEKRNGKR